MKFLIIATTAALVSVSSIAFAKSIQADYNFTFQNQSKSFQVQDSAVLHDDGRWAPLGAVQRGVTLLSSLKPAANNTFTIEYMVIDTETTPTSVQDFTVVTPLNMSAGISIEQDDKSKLSVSVTLKEIPIKLSQPVITK